MKKILILCFSLLIISGCLDKHNLSLSTIDNPAPGSNSSLPNLFTDNSGKVFMSWVEESGKTTTLKHASFNDGEWSEAETVASDSTWFVNWADYPSLIGYNGVPLAAHWLDKIPGNTYSYNIELATFGDESWNDSFTLHDDGTQTEHGFVSLYAVSASEILAVWLDGRKTAGRAHDEYSDISKAMTLRSALVDKKLGILEKVELDSSVCDCCNTSIAKTKNGFIAAYRGRTEDEIRDIYTVSYTNGAWKEPEVVYRDHWQIAACPVNGPKIDAREETVAVAWYTAAADEAQIKLAISKNEGASFSEPLLLDSQNPTGRVDLAISNNRIWVSWITGIKNETASLAVHSFNFDGDKLDAFSIDGISTSRRSGFPQISTYQNGLLIAYTNFSNSTPGIKTMVLK